MAETVKIKLRVDSDPYRLIQTIQTLDPKDVDEYIKRQAERIARNDAINEVRKYPVRGGSYDAMMRQHRVVEATKELLPRRINQLSKYKIKIHRMEQVDDGMVEITGEKI